MRDTKVSKNLMISLCLITTIVGTGSGFLISTLLNQNSNIKKIEKIYNVLKNDWLYAGDYEDIDEYLTQLAIKGLTDNGDPYTIYTPNMEDQGLSTTYVAMGITSVKYDGGFKIVHVNYKSGAYLAGLRDGDIIREIKRGNGDFLVVKDQTFEVRETMLKGLEINDVVSLKIERDGSMLLEPINVIVQSFVEDAVYVRDEVKTATSVSARIVITSFLGNVTNEMERVMDLLTNNNTLAVDKIIFDLRDNGGGYVNEFLTLSDLFVDKNLKLMSYRYSDNKTASYYSKTATKYEIPDMRFIINEGTASASESFVLAMNDLLSDDVTIFGKQSYGKGIAQNFVQFSDGSVMRYTFAQNYGPNGTTIHKIGISADEEIAYDAELLRSIVLPIKNGEELSTSKRTLLSRQLKYLGYEGESNDELLRSFQTTNSLPVNLKYDMTTYDCLSKVVYDKYIAKVDETTAKSLSYVR